MLRAIIFLVLTLPVVAAPLPKTDPMPTDADLQGDWQLDWGQVHQHSSFSSGEYFSPEFGGGEYFLLKDGLVEFAERAGIYRMRLKRSGQELVGEGWSVGGVTTVTVRMRRCPRRIE